MKAYHTGDWVMSRPLPGKERLFHKGILLIANHTHDELLYDDIGQWKVGNATMPYYQLTPFSERLQQVERGEIAMAVFRWRSFCEEPLHFSRTFDHFRQCVGVSMETMAALRIPYDRRAIATHCRNYIRRYIPFLPPNLRTHREAHVYCTEGCWITYRVSNLDLNAYIGEQPLVAPCHSERLFEMGKLKLMEDHGLMRFLNGFQ